jgi:copper chaperone CopZ
MTHKFKITGMTCASCQAKVQNALENVEGVTAVNVDLQKGEADVTMQKHIDTTAFQNALKPYPKYQITEITENEHIPSVDTELQKSWFQTYKPVLLIFAYITGITLLIQLFNETFNWMEWMNHFMAGFFLVFSFFKLLNLSGFADSYSTYDIIARRWRGYGFVYAFTELALGLAFITGFNPVLTNSVTLVIMSISLIGVLQSILNKRKIKCACLGDVFNLPMSSITVIEDVLMIAMSAIMLITMI